jgi:hypothetical protein
MVLVTHDPEPTFFAALADEEHAAPNGRGEVGTATTGLPGAQDLSSAPASFRLKLRPFTSINLRMVFPPAGG